MQCPKCQFENREGVDFCEECGAKLELECPNCEIKIPLGRKFCGKCGYELNESKEIAPLHESEHDAQIPERPPDKTVISEITAEGERKYVTVLFSDLSGYTALSEKLDPEEVKEITSRIFGEISKIVANYDGFIEKYAGDAVMALFGATASHEDDPVRAINAARKIHKLVDSINPQYVERIGQSLSMHSGINTGLVVTGEVNFEKGTHGVAGDTVNVAARLCGLGSASEIVVSRNTYVQSEGYFDFEDLGHFEIKGKSEPVRVYKVLALKSKPVKIHRLQGLRASLIGRNVEMDLLAEAAQKLRTGKGSILSICGTAGTGKSRLVEEFKSTLNLEKVQWLEGHAYPFSQNMPYYPLINLLNRSLQIEEADSPEKVGQKIETGLSNLIGQDSEFIQIIGSLYDLSFPEIDVIDPKYWKLQLQKAVNSILSALAQRALTIVCMEDLHWADPSFLDLLHVLLSQCRYQILFLCIYRPVISLFSSHQLRSMAIPHQEIRLQDLSPLESQGMMESLLKTDNIPTELKRFVQDKVAGNPFYVEEMINSLIESETLVRDDEGWKVVRPITESEISSTIHGVIAGRLDRLEIEVKQIVQEASVIGRRFLYKILKRISQFQDHIDKSLSDFEQLDLIRIQSFQPELEYVFKHALTQEVIYNGLLKKKRRKIHELIGLVMEQIFAERLAEIYETLAFHFARAQSLQKAVDYLIKSGEKSLKMYAVEESHQYFKESYNLLIEKPDLSEKDKELLIYILIKWAYVFYYRGDFKSMVALFRHEEGLAESLRDKTRKGFFFAWLGMALWIRENLKESEYYLRKAIELGEDSDDQVLIGYACCWLSFTCSELGLLNEALDLANKAHDIAKALKSDHYLFFKSLNAQGYAYFIMGFCTENFEIGKALLDYGNKHNNIRSLALGYLSISMAQSSSGNYALAIESGREAIKVSADPFYSFAPKPIMALSYLMEEEFKEAESIGNEILSFSRKFGCEYQGNFVFAILGLVKISNGKMAEGLKQIEDVLQRLKKIERKGFIPVMEYVMGKIYFQIYTGQGSVSLMSIIKNIFFLIKTMPFASKRAEYHFKKAIEMANEIGAKGVMGQAYLDLGLLYKTKKKKDQAHQYISKAIQLFEETNSEIFLKQARQALEC